MGSTTSMTGRAILLIMRMVYLSAPTAAHSTGTRQNP